MPEILPKSIQRLIRTFAKLPGVGNRTAMRFALFLLGKGDQQMDELARSIDEVRASVRLCSSCFALAEKGDLCELCQEPSREAQTVCVVEGIADLIAVENAGLYRGKYFVLHKLLSPLKGVGPKELHFDRLLQRVREERVQELILATPLTTDGEATATWLGRALASEKIKVTRLAAGVPVGGSIEYLDRVTLSRALQDRKDL